VLRPTSAAVGTSVWGSARVAVRSERASLDEGHVAIKRQFFPVQTFERNLLDERSLVPNLEELLRCVHKENYRLTGKTPV